MNHIPIRRTMQKFWQTIPPFIKARGCREGNQFVHNTISFSVDMRDMNLKCLFRISHEMLREPEEKIEMTYAESDSIQRGQYLNFLEISIAVIKPRCLKIKFYTQILSKK